MMNVFKKLRFVFSEGGGEDSGSEFVAPEKFVINEEVSAGDESKALVQEFRGEKGSGMEKAKQFLNNWKHTIVIQATNLYIQQDNMSNASEDLAHGNYLKASARAIASGVGFGMATFYSRTMDGRNNPALAKEIAEDNERLNSLKEKENNE